MSLIDDALRRAQSARGGAPSPAGPPDPWTTGPLPDPGRGGRRRVLLVAAVAALVAGGVGAWLLWRGPAPVSREAGIAPRPEEKEPTRISSPRAVASVPGARTPTPPATLPPSHAPAAAAPVPPSVRTEAASAIARGGGPGRDRVVLSATPTPAARQIRSREENTSFVPVPAMRSASSSPEIGYTFVPPPPPVPTAAPPPARAEREHTPPHRPPSERRDTARGEITVPGGKIELGGIVYSEANPVAVINGHVVGVGAFVEGFMVVAIEENRVELSNDQRTIVLTLR